MSRNLLPTQRRDRCVTCARTKAEHTGEDLICVGSAGRVGKRFGTDNLPEGKTCADCFHTERCVSLFGVLPENQTCDFFPVRYLDRAQ